MSSIRLILASASARRAELLDTAGIDFRQYAVPHEEAMDELYKEALRDHEPIEAAKRAITAVAVDKYKTASQHLKTNDLILTADTIVFYRGKILGKPKDLEDARAMLQEIAGQEHQVLSAVCIGRADGYDSFVVESSVIFHPYDHDPEALESYLLQGRVLEYAGAYGIQDPDFPLVSGYVGSLTNIIGLPMDETLGLLKDLISSG